MTPEEIVSRLLHRDASVLVLDKPAGLPVHPGPGGGETLSGHLEALRFGLPRRPEIAHRLDRDTSGCLVLGRHPRAIARLNELFRGSAVEKTYWAVVEGGPAEDEGEIALRIGPRPGQSWRMRADPKGQEALTRWRVLGRGVPSPPPCGEGPGVGVVPLGSTAKDEVRPCPETSVSTPATPTPVPSPQGGGERSPRGEALTLLELTPVTGRTHQLRVHCAEAGWPILGDPVYGRAPRGALVNLHLHARRIGVPFHPRKPAVVAEAPVPERMRAAVAACGG